MQHVEETAAKLQEMKDFGIQVSLDDFGTGYSSLNYLKRFPIDAIKIDRSFVKDIEKNRDSASIVNAIIAIGHSLNLKVIAEGVETGQQLTFLRENGCDQAQGYLISAPLPKDALMQFLKEAKSLDIKMC
jgi:EAL domain-containing protein (putative c-di-GMP-specific phosphodiesterase class I)